VSQYVVEEQLECVEQPPDASVGWYPAVVVGKNESAAGHSARSIGGIVGAAVGATVVGGCVVGVADVGCNVGVAAVGVTANGGDQHSTQPLRVTDPSVRHVKVSFSATRTLCGPDVPWYRMPPMVT